MWLIDNIFDESFQKKLERGSIAAVGAFDGIHWGHRFILEGMAKTAKAEDMIGVAITFSPHPREFLDPDGPPFLITTLEEKIEILGELGVEALAIIPFGEILSLSPREFVYKYIVRGVHARDIWAGYNHTFGRGGVGNVDSLKVFGEEFGYNVRVIPPFTVNGEVISSTKVRETMAEGDMEMTSRLLGRRYSLRGMVVKGNGRGRTLGFPTANLEVEKRKLLPKDGVYVVTARVNGNSLSGIMNIGFRPTFGENARNVEVHIIDFSGDLYGLELEADFVSRLRDEISFHDLDTLKLQIAKDRKNALVSF